MAKKEMPSPLDIYLAPPTEPIILTSSMISKCGKFWLYCNQLYYRTCNGQDVRVDHINVTKSSRTHNHLLVRINGTLIPTLALEQLRILLSTMDKESYVLRYIQTYRSILEQNVEEFRRIL